MGPKIIFKIISINIQKASTSEVIFFNIHFFTISDFQCETNLYYLKKDLNPFILITHIYYNCRPVNEPTKYKIHSIVTTHYFPKTNSVNCIRIYI